MRYRTRQVTLDVKPWPTYWFCIIDTGRLCHDPRTSRAFYQNYDDDFYVKLNQWCVYEFGRGCRTAYNEFYFRTREEFDQFRARWL
jgi:hypothetical protein